MSSNKKYQVKISCIKVLFSIAGYALYNSQFFFPAIHPYLHIFQINISNIHPSNIHPSVHPTYIPASYVYTSVTVLDSWKYQTLKLES